MPNIPKRRQTRDYLIKERGTAESEQNNHMTEEQRKRLMGIKEELEHARTELGEIKEEQEAKLENLHDHFYNTPRYEQTESEVDDMFWMRSYLYDVINTLEDYTE